MTALRIAALLVLCCASAAHAQTWVAAPTAGMQVPPLTDADVGGATASFTMMATPDGGLEYSLSVMSVTNLTMAHIHMGNASESGPVLVTLIPKGGNPAMLASPATGDYSVSNVMIMESELMMGMTLMDLLDAADSGDLYVNIHTTEYPAGAIRAQIMPVPNQMWESNLNAANQPEMVDSSATGSFQLMEDSEGMMFSYTLDVMNINNLTMAHIHAGNSTTAGPVVVQLVPVNSTDGMLSTPESGTQTYMGMFGEENLMSGWTMTMLRDALRFDTMDMLYINVHTTEYPAGAIRGQLMNSMAMAPAMAPSMDMGMDMGMPM